MIVAGAGGFALQMIPTLERLSLLEDVYFYIDAQAAVDPIIERNFQVVRGIDSLHRHWETHSREFIVAIGGKNREAFYNKLIKEGGKPVSIIDPTSKISKLETYIGIGTVILQDVIVEPGVRIGDCCLINIRCSLTHQVQIGNFVELSPGTTLLGNVSVGDNCFLGAESVVLPEVLVGTQCIVGAGAVVNRPVTNFTKVVGVPAKRVNPQ
jgi:sugar O-acyltransferase (sialic acid O-acetyltransferase NeuD family)